MATLELGIDTPRWALPLLQPARYKGASGGRASGKSHFFAELAVLEMVEDPALRFVCIREVQKSLEYSAKSLVQQKIKRLGLEHCFEVQRAVIRRVGGDGVMIFQGMQDHTADSLKSLEGFRRAWVEEAQSISERSLRLLRPTIRADGSELWFSWNPDQPDDPVDTLFAQNAGEADFVHVHTTFRDNPFCPDVMRKEAETDRRKDPVMYEHIWDGGYYVGRSGRVYLGFRNKPHPEGNLDEGVEDTGAEILVGMDFNVNPMSAIIAVRAGDECHVLDAIEVPTSSTEEMAAEIMRRYPNRRVVVCPDPSGKARKTSAPVGQTDFTILERAGFRVRAPDAAPLVVDRINNTNAMLYEAETGRRRVLVHPRAKALVKALSHMAYKEDRHGRSTSIPDKAGGYDHITDALGYLLWQEFNTLVQPRRVRTFSHRV
jgi:PBSX family phage terminase large subunit